METTIFSTLSEFSVPALSVMAIAYVMIKGNESRETNTQRFLDALDTMRNQHETNMDKREAAFRALEKEVRDKVLGQLSENSKIMERVISHLDRRS